MDKLLSELKDKTQVKSEFIIGAKLQSQSNGIKT